MKNPQLVFFDINGNAKVFQDYPTLEAALERFKQYMEYDARDWKWYLGSYPEDQELCGRIDLVVNGSAAASVTPYFE